MPRNHPIGRQARGSGILHPAAAALNWRLGIPFYQGKEQGIPLGSSPPFRCTGNDSDRPRQRCWRRRCRCWYWTRVQGHGPNRDLRSTQPIPLGGPSLIEKLYPCVHLIGAVGGKGQELLDVVVGPVGALGKIDATRPNSLEMRGQTLPFGTRVGCTRDDCQPAEGRRLVDQRRTIAGVLNKRDVWEVLTAEAHER